MTVVEPTSKEDKTRNLRCLKGWCMTIKAIMLIWTKIQEEVIASSLVTRQLNQDPLDHFFGSIRQQGGRSDIPTPVQFIRAYRKLFHVDLLTVAGNCEVDDNKLIASLEHLDSRPTYIFTKTEKTEPIQILLTDYASEHIQKRIVKEHSLAYIAGFLLRKTFMLHRCDKCSILATDNLATNESPFLDFKAYDSYSTSFRGLITPSDVMLAYTTALEDLFVAFFKSLKQTKNIAQSLMKNLHDVHIDINCPHF